jgi:hypothetical protein
MKKISRAFCLLMFVPFLVFAEPAADQAKLNSLVSSEQKNAIPAANKSAYVIGQAYFPEVPKEIARNKEKATAFIENMTADNISLSVWPMLILMKINTSEVKGNSFESLFIKGAKISTGVVMQVKDKEGRLLGRPGAILFEVKNLYDKYDDLLKGFPLTQMSQNGRNIAAFINFDPDPTLVKEASEAKVNLGYFRMESLEEGWSTQRKAESIAFMRSLMLSKKS